MRKTKIVVIDAEGRDQGKRFLLTEMPADQAERWAIRATMALSHTEVTEMIPPQMLSAGWAALAYGALKAFHQIAWEELRPLLEEMMGCVRALPDPANDLIVRPLVENDIEEVRTRFQIRAELFTLHSGFSFADVQSRWMSASTAARTRTTSTSRRRSGRRSPAG